MNPAAVASIDTTLAAPAESLQSAGVDLRIFVVCFAAVLAIAVLAQLLALNWREWLPGAGGEKSFIHAVKSAAYMLMSYLTLEI